MLLILSNYFSLFSCRINNDSLLRLAVRSTWCLKFTPGLLWRDHNNTAGGPRHTNLRILQLRDASLLVLHNAVIPLILSTFSSGNTIDCILFFFYIRTPCWLQAMFSVLAAWTWIDLNEVIRNHRTYMAKSWRQSCIPIYWHSHDTGINNYAMRSFYD